MNSKSNRRPQLKDVAERAGVSISLASFVMNGKAKQYRVADKKAQMILKVAQEMNYVPNMMAKGLRSGKSNTLGLVVADISAPVFAKLSRKVEDYAYSRGYSVIFGSTDERSDKSQRVIDTMRSRGVDGFLLCASEGSEGQVEELLSSNIPTVLIDRFFSSISAPTVKLDNFSASYNGVRHLIGEGFKKIAIFSYDTNLEHVVDRIKGCEKAIEEESLAKIEYKIRHANLAEDTLNAIDNILSSEGEEVDAVFFTAGQICTEAMRVLRSRVVDIPKDLAVISFDLSDTYNIFYTPITHIEQPIEEFAIKGVDMVIEQIENGDISADNVVTLQPTLHIHESTIR